MSSTPNVCTWCSGTKKHRVTHIATGEMHGMPCACVHTDLPIPFLYQEEDCGCGIAALAMATRRSYSEVRRLIVMSEDLSGHTIGAGVNVAQVDDILEQLGFAWQARYPSCHRLALPRDPWPCAPWADVHLCHVRNLSDSGHHYVVMIRDGRVLDPWWGVVQGLHRYPGVHSIKAVYAIRDLTEQPIAAQADGLS